MNRGYAPARKRGCKKRCPSYWTALSPVWRRMSEIQTQNPIPAPDTDARIHAHAQTHRHRHIHLLVNGMCYVHFYKLLLKAIILGNKRIER